MICYLLNIPLEIKGFSAMLSSKILTVLFLKWYALENALTSAVILFGLPHKVQPFLQ